VGESLGEYDAVSLVAGGQHEEVGDGVGIPERRVVYRTTHENRSIGRVRYGSAHGGRVAGIGVRLADELERRLRALLERPGLHQVQYPLARYPLRHAEGAHRAA
jgi:hypothetical protein